jgi:O-antigen ligase
MVLPLLWSIVLDLVKHRFNLGQLDEYLRPAMCAPALYFLMRNIQIKHFQLFKWLFSIGFIGLCMMGWWTPHTWGDRFATYWVDPSVMGLAACVGAGSLLYLAGMEWLRKGPLALRCVLTVGLGFALYALLASGTRAAWLGFLGVCCCTVLLPRKPLQRVLIVGVTAVALAVAYVGSSSLQARVEVTITDVGQWFRGEALDGAVGQRLSIVRAGLILASEAPWLGRTDQQLHDEVLQRMAELKLTEASSQVWAAAGTHNHLLEKMLTNGVVGLLAALALLVVPLVFFLSRISSFDTLTRDAAALGIVICVSYFLYGFGNILTLKYVNSFYAAWVVMLIALVLRKEAGELDA